MIELNHDYISLTTVGYRKFLSICYHFYTGQTITGFGEAGAAVVSCPSIDKIIFTGSPSVGKLVMAGASQYLKPVILELGGKDPMVFCDDVKLKVSQSCVATIFFMPYKQYD